MMDTDDGQKDDNTKSDEEIEVALVGRIKRELTLLGVLYPESHDFASVRVRSFLPTLRTSRIRMGIRVIKVVP